MSASLLQTFRDLDGNLKHALADLDSPLLLAFAALSIAGKQCSVERMSAEHIIACLEAAGVSVKKNSVSRALARAGNRVSAAKDEDGEVHYRLMTRGEREIMPHLDGGGISLVRIDGSGPRTARSHLGDILSTLRGTIRVCDPYYGVRTFDSLDHIAKSCKVRFLTSKTNEAGRKLRGALQDFRRERKQVDFRLAPSSAALHDRYVLSTDQLLIVGHGLKDVGAKESFIIQLDKKWAQSLIADTRKSFDAKWQAATPL